MNSTDKDAKEESSVFYIPGVELAFPQKGLLSNVLFSWMKTQFLPQRQMEEKEMQGKTKEEKETIEIKYDEKFDKIDDQASRMYELVHEHLWNQLSEAAKNIHDLQSCKINEGEDNIGLKVTLKTGQTFEVGSYGNVYENSDCELVMECDSEDPVCKDWFTKNKEFIEMAERLNQWIYDYTYGRPSERGEENWID